MRVNVIDTETTGLEDTDEIIEIAWWQFAFDEDEQEFSPALKSQWMFKPSIPIGFDAMATHHITEEDVANCPPISSFKPKGLESVTHYAAHNMKFDRVRLDKILPPKPWICTYRCALHLFPDAPSHRNAALRYFFRDPLPNDPAALPHHRALPDAYVTMRLLKRMLLIKAPEELVRLSTAPVILKKVGFGKHFGQAWSAIPVDYLDWVIKQQDMDMDVAHTARHELAQRNALRSRTGNADAHLKGLNKDQRLV